jgi:hypothetical protein
MANVNPIPEPVAPQMPVVDEPLFNPNVIMPTVNPTIEPQVEPTMMQPPVEPTMEPVVAEPVNEPAPMPEGLGFMAPNSFEIPVVNTEPTPVAPVETPVQEPIEQDRLTQLQELLTNNGFEFNRFNILFREYNGNRGLWRLYPNNRHPKDICNNISSWRRCTACLCI